ncbi:MAG: methyltransferase domain-containing protein [Nitrospinae bacterium]|nr:methyltransferase domain-containing protein [Nitrospinota bacterium]
MQFTSREIQQKYNEFAPRYDLLEAIPELLGVRRLRRILLNQAKGNVLEVAVGTGKNFRYYPQDCQIIAVDLSPAMLKAAMKRA